MALTADLLADYAAITETEFILIDSKCELARFRNELRWNDLYYHLNRGLI
jgi:L-arabinose isomerase